MSFPRYCVECDRTITGRAIVAAQGYSASGARPDANAHAPGDPECTARRATPSMLHQALDALPPTARG